MAPRAPKLTVNAAPSEALVKASTDRGEVVDSKGRKFGLRTPTLLDELNLSEIVGASSSNSGYMFRVTPLIYVETIDGEHVGVPTSKPELDALAIRVGHEGYAAIMGWYVPNVLTPIADAMQAAEAKERVKK